jgi:hypothetical protein
VPAVVVVEHARLWWPPQYRGGGVLHRRLRQGVRCQLGGYVILSRL